MLPGPLVPETKHSLIIVHPAAILAVSDPSAERLKCSWHLGMMMRIIETLLLKGKSDLMFCRKTLFSQKKHPDQLALVRASVQQSWLRVCGRTLVRLRRMMMRLSGVLMSLRRMLVGGLVIALRMVLGCCVVSLRSVLMMFRCLLVCVV
jgi:hypothetical protein